MAIPHVRLSLGFIYLKPILFYLLATGLWQIHIHIVDNIIFDLEPWVNATILTI
jgi:hypothetical protein